MRASKSNIEEVKDLANKFYSRLVDDYGENEAELIMIYAFANMRFAYEHQILRGGNMEKMRREFLDYQLGLNNKGWVGK